MTYSWHDTEEELLKLINELNQKYKTIKFDCKYAKAKILFLDVLVCKEINNRLQTTLYTKTNRSPKLSARKLGTPEIIIINNSL